MPIGILKDTDARISKFDTKSGDIIVMMSDGCCPDSEDCPWLVEFLCEYMARKDKNALGNESECEILCQRLLSLAKKNSPKDKTQDDISVTVIIIE
jgi:serine phosphatase RsbU (regulator of sigma subunit)